MVTKDSKQFTDALEGVRYPLVLAKQNTPRTAKRFVNRLRYLAMRQRAYEDKALTWEKVLFPQRLREPAGTGTGAAIPEPLLVAMAAIEQLAHDPGGQVIRRIPILSPCLQFPAPVSLGPLLAAINASIADCVYLIIRPTLKQEGALARRSLPPDGCNGNAQGLGCLCLAERRG